MVGGVVKCAGVWGEARKDVWGGVWESVWGEWGKVCWRVGKGCKERNGGGVGNCIRVWGPTHFPTSPPSPHSLHLSYISRYLPHIPTHLPTPPLIPLPHLPFLPPHPNTFSYYPHIFPHLLKVWRSYHVMKFLWRSYHVAKLSCGEVTGNHKTEDVILM